MPDSDFNYNSALPAEDEAWLHGRLAFWDNSQGWSETGHQGYPEYQGYEGYGSGDVHQYEEAETSGGEVRGYQGYGGGDMWQSEEVVASGGGVGGYEKYGGGVMQQPEPVADHALGDSSAAGPGTSKIDFAAWAKAGSLDKVASTIRQLKIDGRRKVEGKLFPEADAGSVDAQFQSTFSQYFELPTDSTRKSKKSRQKSAWQLLIFPYGWATKKVFPDHTVDSLCDQLSQALHGSQNHTSASKKLVTYAKELDKKVIKSARDVTTSLSENAVPLPQAQDFKATETVAAALAIAAFADGGHDSEARMHPLMIQPADDGWSTDTISDDLTVRYKWNLPKDRVYGSDLVKGKDRKGPDRLDLEQLVASQLYYARLMLGSEKTLEEIMVTTDPGKETASMFKGGAKVSSYTLMDWAKRVIAQAQAQMG